MLTVFALILFLHLLLNFKKTELAAATLICWPIILLHREKKTSFLDVRTVVIEFETLDIAKNFFYSKEYQAAHAILADSVIRNHQIIEGT